MIQRMFLVLCLLASSAAADSVISINTAAQLQPLLSNGGSAAPDGTVIELAAGTYSAPSGGFLVFNPNRTLTLRAATPGSVFLDGGNSQRIFRYIVDDSSRRGSLVFEGLTFRNGRSTDQSFGSAMTLQDGAATFVDCVFEDNVNASVGNGSGTIGLRQGSSALLLRSRLEDNTSLTSGAGVVIVTGSTLWCHECQFLRNRNNVPGHAVSATGGAMVAADESQIFLSNSRFEANQAGFAGGAFDVKGEFTEANPVRLIASNSTFVDNIAMPDPGVATSSPAAGGIGNVEDNAVAQFYNSRFFDNTAQFGGAFAVYRADLEVYDSVFRGNWATGQASSNTPPRGGVIFAISTDTGVDGANNRPNARLVLQNSLLDGEVPPEASPQTATAHTGGCVFINGDLARFLGQGVSQDGTQAENSAILEISDSAFVNCDVDEIFLGEALGGGIYSLLTIATISDSMFLDNDASGLFGGGGAMAFTRFTDAEIRGTTFANNFAQTRGGAMFVIGSEIDINGSTFLKNTVPGASDAASFGAALFAGPQDGASLGVEGIVRNSSFILNNGLAIYDDDRSDASGIFNTVTYQNNDFFENTFSDLVYRDLVAGAAVNVAGLNAMVVDRGNGNTTDKAPLNDNTALGSQPEVGVMLAVPPGQVDRAAAGDVEATTTSYLAYAWCGECAELDGSPLGSNTGVEAGNPTVHSLMVFDNGACSGIPSVDETATITQAPTPAATLNASPVMIMGGGSSDLQYSVTSGNFLQSALDRDIGILSAAAGTETVSPPLTLEYSFFAITQQGGVVSRQKVYVDEEPGDLIFSDGFESGDTTSW